MLKFSYSQRPGINRVKSNRQARFIGRIFVAGGFIPWRRWQTTRYTAFRVLAILLLFSLLGCQTNSQQSTENEERITETAVPSDTPPATAVPTSPNLQSPISPLANADVTFVRAVSTGSDTWTFHVTVDHPDTGWEDYANGWDVVLPDGTIIKPDETSPFTRLLLHPHETERPFTRSQSNITIPTSITTVTVRAHDLVDGFGGKEVVVDLTAVSGTDFEIEQ